MATLPWSNDNIVSPLLPFYLINFVDVISGRMSINDLNRDIFMQTGAHFFQKLLIYDPAKRISAKEALAHPYFGDMNWEEKLA